MTVRPIPVSQTHAAWFSIKRGNRRPEPFTDVNLCVYLHAGEISYVTQGYLGEDAIWFTRDDQKIDGEILAWAAIEDSRHTLATIASRDWRLWL